MADVNYEIKDGVVYDPEIRALRDTDPASATHTFNPLFQKMVDNTHAVKQKTDVLDEKTADVDKKVEKLVEDLGDLDPNSILMSDGTSIEVAITEKASKVDVDEALTKKADLVNGQVPAEQLPEMDYDLKGSAATVQNNLNSHTVDTGLHVTAEKHALWNNAAKIADEAYRMAEEALGREISKLFVLLVDFDDEFTGKTFTVAGGELFYTGSVSELNQGVVEVPNANTSYIITCDGYSTTISVDQYYGVYTTTLLYASRVLAENSWVKIARVSESGLASDLWLVGDTKDITLDTGETLTLQIYGFDHDELANGERVGITFGLKNLMADRRAMEVTNTNMNSFSGSELYNWMVNTLFVSLPVDLQTLIKPVVKKTSAGNGSENILTEIMNIFLFSEIECFGATSNSVPGEGSTYSIFTDNESRIKYLANGTEGTTRWWERSPRRLLTSGFCYVNSSGKASGGSATADYIGICFGFCI